MAYASIGASPTNFVLDELGSEGYTMGADGVLYNFPITATLQNKNILNSTVNSTASITNLLAPASGLWAADNTGNALDYFTGSPETFNRAISLSGTQPVAVAGPGSSSGQYQYVLSQNLSDATICNTAPTTVTTNGTATPITVSTLTAGNAIALGKCPVFGAQSTDLQRLFVLNRGDSTITVINTQKNALDSCTPYQNVAGTWVTCHPTISLPTGSGPVFAEYNATKQQLIVANYDGGTISVIDVPLDKYGNDANTYTGNCVDSSSGSASYAACGNVASGFGTVHTITVGNTSHPYPASVSALYDGTKAYTANQGDDTTCITGGTCSGNGTVTVVNLDSYTVEKTLTVTGHPRTVVSTQNSTISKVYASSPDSPYLTVIKSSGSTTDVINTTLLTQGNIVDVRVTTQNGSSGTNPLYVSRTPGYGTPCNLPPSAYSSLTLATCRAMPN
jgi:DNA-binding beta-propeller fold protein YncE